MSQHSTERTLEYTDDLLDIFKERDHIDAFVEVFFKDGFRLKGWIRKYDGQGRLLFEIYPVSALGWVVIYENAILHIIDRANEILIISGDGSDDSE
jgi:sRNA-binding regulator protein Hfq